MESLDQRREREELVGQVADIIQLAADLSKKAAFVMETLMLWNPPQEGQGEPPEPETPKFVPLSRPEPAPVPEPPKPEEKPEPYTATSKPKHKPIGETRRNRILTTYEHNGQLRPEDFARELKMGLAEVLDILQRARLTKDPRVIAGDKLRDLQAEIPATTEKNPEPRNELEAMVQERAKPEPTVMKARNGVSLPRLNLPPLAKEERKPPGWHAPVLEIPEGVLLIAKEEERAVHAPKGYFRASRTTIDVMIRLSDGGMYPVHALTRIGKWPSDKETESALRGMKALLAECGLDLQVMGGLVKLNRQKVNA